MVGIRGVTNHPSNHLFLRARILIYPTDAGHQCDIGVLPSQMGTMNGSIKETGSYQKYVGVVSIYGTGDSVTRIGK